jgi:hypothetical protein
MAYDATPDERSGSLVIITNLHSPNAMVLTEPSFWWSGSSDMVPPSKCEAQYHQKKIVIKFIELILQ